MMSQIRKNGAYLAMTVIIIAITAGNYFINGGAKSNWIEVTDYGFKMRYPPYCDLQRIGLDYDHVFDISGSFPVTMENGMLNFNKDNYEYALTWATLGDSPSLEEVLDIYYHSVEVNAIRRDRVSRIEYEPVTYGTVNGHEAAYQIHLLELDMPDMEDNLYARGLVVGWICDRTGISYTFYLLPWGVGSPFSISDAELLKSLNDCLKTVECH